MGRLTGLGSGFSVLAVSVYCSGKRLQHGLARLHSEQHCGAAQRASCCAQVARVKGPLVFALLLVVLSSAFQLRVSAVTTTAPEVTSCCIALALRPCSARCCSIPAHVLSAAAVPRLLLLPCGQGAVAEAADGNDEDGLVSVVPEELRLEVLEARRGGASRSGQLVGPLLGLNLPDRPVVSGGVQGDTASATGLAGTLGYGPLGVAACCSCSQGDAQSVVIRVG